MVRLEDAGIGLAPQSAANALSLRKRSMFWPAVTSNCRGVPGRDTKQLRGARSGPSDELLKLGVEVACMSLL